MFFIYGWLLSVLLGAAFFFVCVLLSRGLNCAKYKEGEILILKGLETWHDKNHKIIEILNVGKRSYLYKFLEIQLSIDSSTIVFKKNDDKSLIKESDFLYINNNYERFKNKASKLADIIYK